MSLTTERAFETYGEAAIEGLQEYPPPSSPPPPVVE
jgi:hypothetical protein